MQETQFRYLGWEDPLEKKMATHSSVLAWEIHGQRHLRGYSPWGQRVRHDWATKPPPQVPITNSILVTLVVQHTSAFAHLFPLHGGFRPMIAFPIPTPSS